MKKALLLTTICIYAIVANAQDHTAHVYADTAESKDSVHVFHQPNDNNYFENQFFFISEKEYDEEKRIMERKIVFEPEPNIFFFHYHNNTTKIGVYGSSSLEPKDSTAQILGGLLYRIPIGDGVMEFGLGSGYEVVYRHDHIKSGMPFLVSSLIAYEDKNEKLTALTIGEFGPEGHWYLFSVNYRFGKSGPFGIGIHAQKDAPSGLRLNFYVGKHFTFWTAAGICFEKHYAPGVAVCIKYNLRLGKAT